MSRLKHPVARWIALLLAGIVASAPRSANAVATVNFCTQSDLEAKIFQARTNGGDGIVRFNCDGTILLTNTVTLRFSPPGTNGLTNAVFLDASGHSITISGQTGTNFAGQGRLFQLESGVGLVVANIKFVNGQSTNGAAFLISSNSAFFAAGCVFSNNVVNGSNGLAGANARTDTVVGKASDGRGGTAATTGGGGAIYNLGYAWFSHCTFLTNGVFAGNGGSGGNGGDGTITGGDGGNGGRGGAALGGAIYNQGRLFTTNCSFYGNYALGGVGGAGGTSGIGIFSGFAGHGAAGGGAAGGAIYNHPKSSATNINTTFALNVTDSGDSADGGSDRGRGKTGAGGPHASGGAIANFGTNILLNCTFFSNGANGGDGGSGSDGSVTGGRGGNGGSAWGGNLFNGKKATLIATHCTISDGGAIGGTNGPVGNGIFPGRNGDRGQSRGGNVANSNGLFTLRNSILAYAANGTNGYYTGKAFTFDGRNISSDRSIKVVGVPRASVTLLLTNLDPRLDTLQRNGGPVETIRLLDDSPAINMASSNYNLALDARGVGRPATTNVDVGSYEHGVGLVAPRIVSHPEDATVVRSNTAIFIVTAQGDPPLFYQWRKNGAAISNATSSAYVLTNAQESSEGNYDVLVSNNSGFVESDDASLTVVIPATITRQPVGLVLSLGATATFSVTAEGEAPLQYQWFYKPTSSTNGTAILGAVRSTFILTNAYPAVNGDYYVRVANQYRTVYSSNASLTVTSIPPVVVSSPTNYTVIGGSSAAFTATATGTVPLTFLWYMVKDGATNFQDSFESFDGTNTFAIGNAQSVNEGSYFAVVTNYGGLATSGLVTLTVQLIAPLITKDVDDQTVAPGEDAYFSFGVFGSRPVAFQWYSNQTVLLPGATNFSLTITNLSTNGGGTYTVVASNSAGTVTSRIASLIVTNLPPSFLSQPATSFTTRGEDATFSVSMRGSRPFSYQWYFNGDALTNATNATLTVADVAVEDTEGTYYVEVTNEFGNDTSEEVSLYLLEPIEVVCDGQNCNITMPGVDEDNIEFHYTLQFRATPDDAWLGVETLSPDDGRSVFQYTPQPFNGDSAAYRVVITTIDPEGEPFLDLEPTDVVVADGQDAEFTVSTNSSEPVSYRWYYNDTLLVGETRSTLVVSNAQPANAGSYHVVVYGIRGAATSAVVTLTVATDPEPVLIEQPSNVSLFPGEDAMFSVTVVGAGPLNYQWYLDGTNLIAGVNSPTLTVTSAQTTDAGSYHVVVSNSVGVVTSSSATLALLNPLPVITGEPTSLSLFSGEDAVFSVTNTGRAPFAYQWFFNETNLLVGATASSLSLTNVQSSEEGTFQVVITNAFGAVTSTPAILVVSNTPPIVTIFPQPISAPVSVGSPVTLTIAAIGSRPLAYSWYLTPTDENAVTLGPPVLVTNGPSGTLQINSVQFQDQGFYQAFVTNSFGVVSTAPEDIILLVVP